MITTPAADLVANELTALSAATVPFLAAIALFLISPLLTKKVKEAVLRQIDESDADHRVVKDMVPPSRKCDALDPYIEYAMDAVQIIPLTLLPVTGAVFAIAAHVPSPVALGYLSIAVLVAVAVEAWVSSQHPAIYVSHRFIKCYSVVSAAGMASNLLGLAMILIYGLVYGF